jgi:K(+)-stimulated pyrophosphate-energized sodium pump
MAYHQPPSAGKPGRKPENARHAAAIQEGAQAYLKRQYGTIAVVGVVVAVIVSMTLHPLPAVGFIIGAVLSAWPASSA